MIQSYLTVRYQEVLIGTINAYDGVSSRRKNVINGVPRGLMLGSLLLLIYINDIPKITDNDAKVVLFADDTSITVTAGNAGGGIDGRIKLNVSARNGSKVKD